MKAFLKGRQFRSRQQQHLQLNDAMFHTGHKRPITRRDFIAQGMIAGGGAVMSGGVMGMLSNSAFGLSQDLEDLKFDCGIKKRLGFEGKVPFMCFDLAGGANIAGSNVLVGQQGGQLDFLSTAGYSKLGLPANMLPGSSETNFVNTDLGLAFHSDSAFLRGILSKVSPSTAANINGAVIPARSENDTGNNPHNPMYAIHQAGGEGALVDLIGSVSSTSGGNSMAPAAMINPAVRPTKVDRSSDATGLVDLGKLVKTLSQEEVVNVMEAVAYLSDKKLANTRMPTGSSDEVAIKALVKCGYVKSAALAEDYGDPADLDPEKDGLIKGTAGIFSDADFDADREYKKTAAVMKLVVNGFAGAGTVTMGGFDYHTGDRSTGERRDFRAGECMGASLEYAARRSKPLMLYVFSDGSVSSNGMADESMEGRGKGQWTGDNQSTAAAFMLVYSPKGKPELMGGTDDEKLRHQQIGFMDANASVITSATPAANNVNLLVETVALNYMALNGEIGQFKDTFPNHGLGSEALRDSLVAFESIV
ncbi:MAG: general secretion pathway protein GspF [Pseudomonadales bacterium]|nr:general secretion pathway protein GspF [Pseudomonadales bacterium]